jgi:hypothetical protein
VDNEQEKDPAVDRALGAGCTQGDGRSVRRESLPQNLPEDLQKVFDMSMVVLRTHQDKIYPGAMVASLSVPWGNTRDERGGTIERNRRKSAESCGPRQNQATQYSRNA